MCEFFYRGLLFCFVLLCVTSCRSSYHTETQTKGYEGKARVNPYLLAQEYANEYGGIFGEVKQRYGGVYGEETGLVISPASTVEDKRVAKSIIDWVNKGGLYVCLIERGEKKWTDVGQFCDHESASWQTESINDTPISELTGLRYLLNYCSVNIENSDPSGQCTGGEQFYTDPNDPIVMGEELPLVEEVNVPIGYSQFKLQLGGNHILRYNGYDAIFADDGKDYHRVLGLSLGEGVIVFVTDARFLRNPYLKMADHADFWDMLLSGSRGGEVAFFYKQRVTFWQLVIRYASPVMLGFFLLLVLWLWKSIPRKGVAIEVHDEVDRSRVASLLSNGNFLWRYRETHTLLEPLRKKVYRKSGKLSEDNSVEQDLVEFLADKSGLKTEEVLEAMSNRAHKMSELDFYRIIKNLQKILQSL